MRRTRQILTIAALTGALAMALPGLAAAQTVPPADPEAAAARRLYLTKTCVACHGRDGRGAIQDYPDLAGQDEAYIIQQTNDILDGSRVGGKDATGNPRAQGMRGALISPQGERRIDQKEIEKIAAWLAKLEPAKPRAPEKPVPVERIEQGRDVYKRANCISCHGPDGRKPMKTYPIIAGQKRAYIVAQMQDLKSKAREHGKTKLMYPFVQRRTDDQIEAIADYLSQIDPTAK
jgi:cytochrome c553